MEILRTISLYTEGKDLPFVVIGGHAANHYGVSRNTADLDLLVKLSNKESWLVLMDKLNYLKGHDDSRFARFKGEYLASWPIDLMFVDDSTFEGMYSESETGKFGEASVKVVSAKHLALLKIHALKYFQEHRFSKDFSDLVSLVKSGKTTMTDLELKAACEKYASLELYMKIKST